MDKRRQRITPEKFGGRKSGFTLVELMVAAGVSIMLFSLVTTSALYCWRIIRTRLLITEMRQNVRAGSDMICRDLRAAGYGLDVPATQLADWIDWIPGFSSNPMLVAGANDDPDSVVIAAAMDEPVARLALAADGGSQSITLDTGDHDLNTAERKVLFIGRSETVRITSVSGDVLGISSHPTVAQGLRFDHPAGAPVELVRTVGYVCYPDPENYPHSPYLAREDSARETTYSYQDLAANNIENLSLRWINNSIEVVLRGRTVNELHGHEDPVFEDGYRRFTVRTLVRPRHGGWQ